MSRQSTSTPTSERSAYTPTSPAPAPPVQESGVPPERVDTRGDADAAEKGDAYHRLSQAVQRAAAARRSSLSRPGPARTCSLEEEVFVSLHHGCQG